MFKVVARTEVLKNGMTKAVDAIIHGIGYGISAVMNKSEGEIRRKIIGNAVLPKKQWRKIPRPKPPSGQVLWIRTGSLRNTTFGSWRTKYGQEGPYAAQVPLGKNLAIGFMQTAQPYGETLEDGKYPWARPTLEKYVDDGTVTSIMRKYIDMEIAKL